MQIENQQSAPRGASGRSAVEWLSPSVREAVDAAIADGARPLRVRTGDEGGA